MSRFFVSGYNSDSSSSEEDLLSASEDELLSSTSEMSDDSEFANDSDSDSDDSDSDASPSGPAYFLKKSFVKGAKGGSDSDSDSEDEGRKVVKSAKDKLLDDMTQAVDLINTAKRNNAWTSALAEFDRLGRLLIRANKQKTGIPNFFIKCLVSLESYINETTESEKSQKTLNAAEGRAFNTTRQRVKKQVKEFQAHYDLYKASPELFDQDEPVEIVDKDALGNAQQQDSERRLLSPVFSTLRQVAETRGKKNVDKYEQILSLELLVETTAPSGTPFELISIFQMLLSVRFDLASNQTFMPLTQWKSCEKDFNSLLDLLERNISLYQVSELGVPTDDIDIEPTPNDLGVRILTGSVVSLVERLDDELTRSLQNTDSHSSDYLERLKDETIMYKLIVRVQAYMEAITSDAHYQSSEQLARIVMKRFEHVYYKPSDLILANESCAWATIPADSKVASKSSTPAELVDGLSKYLHEHVNHGYRQDALLYSIYFYAVNGQYAKARDMFLTSQIFASIHLAESNVQVHYNRALVQLGLSAFRSGSIDECNKILTEIVNSQRSKELLGQGFASKYPNQATTAEKLKLLPFHQHINLELLDSVYMTCSLLIEIPIIASAAASSSKDSKRKASIKSFKSKLDFYDRQYFAGPPESIKDHIVHASIALQKGDWVKSYDLLSSIKVWKLLPRTDELLAMIKGQLQVEGLRTYIFSYKTIFSKLSVSKLAQKFQMTQDRVSNILNRMLEANEISGSFNDERTFFNFSSNEPQRSRLQELAIVMNEKVGLLSEKNEKTSTNGFGPKLPAQQQQQYQQQQQHQKEQKEMIQEENNRFRFANVNSNNDEFQVTA